MTALRLVASHATIAFKALLRPYTAQLCLYSNPHRRAIYEPSRHRERLVNVLARLDDLAEALVRNGRGGRTTFDRGELARLCTLLTFEVGLYSAGAVNVGHQNGRADLLVDAVTYFLGGSKSTSR